MNWRTLLSVLLIGLTQIRFGFTQNVQNVRPLPNPIININCGALSILRTTGLISPSQNIPTVCTYRINVASAWVCQFRLDFRQLSLAPPTVNPYPICEQDTLKVGDITLCGENAGQHIYVPVARGDRQITITIQTSSRAMQNGLKTPLWNIAVNQIDCPLGMTRSLKSDNVALNETKFELARPAGVIENVRGPRTFFSDWFAPPGCLQFHPNPTGVIETFNLNNGVGPYIGNMQYSICFRRTRLNTAVRFIPVIFRMGYALTTTTNNGHDANCFSSITSLGRSEDYIFIPNAITDQLPPLRATMFCAQSLLSTIVTSTPNGPFMITFNSDMVYEGPLKEEIGFRMQYEIV